MLRPAILALVRQILTVAGTALVAAAAEALLKKAFVKGRAGKRAVALKRAMAGV